MPQFQHIEYLILLILIPLLVILFLFALARKKTIARKLGDKDLINILTANHNPKAYAYNFILLTAAITILIVTLANLRLPIGTQKVTRNGIDVMIALDVSKSMLAQDVPPNRLDRAKQVLGKLIDRLGENRVGIVIFAGKAYLQMPLTSDHGAAKMYLQSATPETVPTQGTAIGDALKMSYAGFNTKEKKYKTIILVTDGEDQEEGSLEVASQLADEGCIIHTVGLGSPQGATIMDDATRELKKDDEGNVVISKLNEEVLKNIAAKGRGQYQLYSNTDEVVDILMGQLNNMDKRNITDDSMIDYKSFFQIFLGLALLILIIEIFIPEKRKNKNNMRILKPALSLFLIFFTSVSFSQNNKEIIKKGNEAYKKEDYPKAAEEYNKVIQDDPANTTAWYNMGNALYKNKKSDDAIKAYDNALPQLKVRKERSNAFYNKGVVLQNNDKLPECIEAYKQALRLSPDDEDARQNLQKALQKQKQQQQKQDKNKDKDEEKDKKDDPKPQPSKITKQDAEEKLKALMQQEKNLQDKLHKANSADPPPQGKDW